MGFRRSLLGALLFWAFLAPALAYAFTALAAAPALLAGAFFGAVSGSPLGEAFGDLVGLVVVAFTVAMVWWVWRVYRGDPPREPRLPSRRLLVGAGCLVTVWLVALHFVEPRATVTFLDAPWLAEPVPIRYPYSAELEGREAVVEVSLYISASGEIERYEFTGTASPEFRAAVSAAIARMHVDTAALGARSYPYRKRLRVPFVLD